MDVATFVWAVIAGGTANKIYDLFTTSDIQKLENLYYEKRQEEFEDYIQILIEDNSSLKDKLQKRKNVFNNLKTEIVDKSIVDIDVEAKSNNLSIGNDSNIKVDNGGSFKFKYKD